MSALISLINSGIQFFYEWSVRLGVPSYGLAIIGLTIFVKLILFPLTAVQLRSLRKMQELQPELQKIQKKYKDNPQKAQQAMMELYRQHKANPFGGCLPLLVQMPILFSLFGALRVFFTPETPHASFWWIPTLGAQDPYYILPLMAGALTFAQQWLSMPAGTDGTQRGMLYFLPLFMAYICSTFPAGLGLYWVVYSAVSIVEQLVVRGWRLSIKEEVRKDA